ncbi:MAG: pantoate--beta-alanine ligase [Thermoflexales bacterium]|nr:pantoate--beta-alanine ligase [Thermoflexales bacterium]
MQLITSIEKFQKAKSTFSGSWGLVPTMGYLHQGHLSLVKRAKADNDHVAVSIFVNPTQFGPNEDLAAYPRDLDHDLSLLKSLDVDLVFNPTPDVMYPPNYQTYITVEDVTKYLEGASRPGHFRGVATVVAKLFNIVGAERAYFGQKDAQQTIVIKRMVADLNLPIDIIICPTLREADGLAMSSRNTYLDADHRQAAPVLYRALTAAKNAFDQGERDGDRLRSIMRGVIEAEPLAKIDYVSAANATTLQELNPHPAPPPSQTAATGEGVLLSMAVRVGKPRLIDNFLYQDGKWLTGEFVIG